MTPSDSSHKLKSLRHGQAFHAFQFLLDGFVQIINQAPRKDGERVAVPASICGNGDVALRPWECVSLHES